MTTRSSTFPRYDLFLVLEHSSIELRVETTAEVRPMEEA
jgi:hypothetical protein